jgi:hypothetical protein
LCEIQCSNSGDYEEYYRMALPDPSNGGRLVVPKRRLPTTNLRRVTFQKSKDLKCVFLREVNMYQITRRHVLDRDRRMIRAVMSVEKATCKTQA